jgi:paraquat-inducible protein A
MTLRSAPLSLWQYGMPEVALMVAIFIVYLPALLLVLLVALSAPLMFGLRAPWLHLAANAVFATQNWAMVEVFIIGVIVSLIKIAAMATVALGVSFWAYAAFSICFTLALTTLDRYQCWEMIEALDQA